MNYNNWYQIIKKHLGNYKKEVLKINENGTFRNKEYSHIIPKELGSKNYLRSSFEKLVLKKHPDWYHMNSSQTVCVNFFAVLDNNELSKLMSAILNREILVKQAEFEYTPVKNSSNYDYYIQDINGNNYYFEIKYSESTIDKKSKASDKSDAYEKYYKNDVKSNPIFKNITENDFMTNHFQAYRNMVKGKGDDYSIFITMRSNEGTYNELKSALEDLRVKDAHNTILLYWENLINDVMELFKDKAELVSYYKEFKDKYIPSFIEG